MMPMPFFALALQAARKSRPEDKPLSSMPKDRRSSIRLVWNTDTGPAELTETPRLTHTKER
jgi:hypothetical protein